jgi:hypothetical protein
MTEIKNSPPAPSPQPETTDSKQPRIPGCYANGRFYPIGKGYCEPSTRTYWWCYTDNGWKDSGNPCTPDK